MKLVINRRIWLRNIPDEQESFLYRPSDGKMCCVGIYLQAIGVPIAELEKVQVAHDIKNLPDEARWLTTRCSGGNFFFCQTDSLSNE